MATRQIAEAKITGANADETFQSIPNFAKHATNLPVNSLTQDDAQACGRDRMKPLDTSTFAVEKNSFR